MGGFIWGFTGVEGSGKSCAMTGKALEHCIMTAEHFGYHTAEAYCSDPDNRKPVFCFDGFELHGKKGTALEQIKLSETIDTAKWLGNFGDDHYKNIVVCIDEVQNVMDSSQSGSVFARLLNHAMAQRRRAGIALMYTLQNWEWLHKRLRWSTHYLSVCRDLSRTRWGKENGLKKGEILHLTTYDCKGFNTGKEWAKLPSFRIKGSKIWPHYDSFAPASLVETQTMVKKNVQMIDWSDYGDIKPSDPDYDPYMRNQEIGQKVMERDEAEFENNDFNKVEFRDDWFNRRRQMMMNSKK